MTWKNAVKHRSHQRLLLGIVRGHEMKEAYKAQSTRDMLYFVLKNHQRKKTK